MTANTLVQIPVIGGPRNGQHVCVEHLPPLGTFFWFPLWEGQIALRGKLWYELELRGGQPVYRFVGRKLPAHVAYVGRN